MLKPLTQWLHQKLSVVQLQKKLHAHEKEMQQQKLQQEKNQRQDVNVVHLQEELRGVEEQQDKLLVEEEQQEKLLVEEEQQEKLLVEEEQREDDADLFLFFFN